MDRQGEQMSINPTFDDWIYENSIPPPPLSLSRPLQYRADVPAPALTNTYRQAQYESKAHVKRKPPVRSNRSQLTLLTLVCLVTFVIFVMILMIFVGGILKGCSCPVNEGDSPDTRSSASAYSAEIPARIKVLEENVTSLQIRLEEKNEELMEIRLLLPKLEEDFGAEFNSTRSNLQDANAKLQKSLTTINSSFMEKSDSMAFKTTQLSSILDTSLDNIEKLNRTLENTRSELQENVSSLNSLVAILHQRVEEINTRSSRQLNSTTRRLFQEDANIRNLLDAINVTLSLKLENLSKLQGPIGPSCFNGSQGPIGLSGPRGFNGTKGPQGLIGPQGFNGSQGPPGPQGPKGAGDFSQCKYGNDSSTGSQNRLTSNNLPAEIRVTKAEPSGKKIVGVSCATDHAQLYLLSAKINPTTGQLFYYCKCYGHHGTGQAQAHAGIKCVMHYWECPLIT